MVLILKKNGVKTVKQQLDELLLEKRTTHKKHQWGKFFGKVKFAEGPVDYQRKWRDE